MQIIQLLMLQYRTFVQIINLFFRVVGHIRKQRKLRIINDESDIEAILIFNNYMQNVMQWLHIILMFIKFVSLKRRKRRLIKPHLLLQILGGYR